LTENQTFCGALYVGNGQDTLKTRVFISHTIHWNF